MIEASPDSLARCFAVGKTRPRLRALGLLCATCAGLSAAAQSPVDRIPEVHGTTLAGQVVHLPAQLQARAAILVIGFSRESRDQATAWGKRLDIDYKASPEVAYYELPMLQEVPKLLRGLVLKAIARDVSGNGRVHFIPLLSDEAQWKSVTHFSDTKDAYVLVVDGTGAVRWQAQGEPTNDRYLAAKKAAAAVAGRGL